LRIFLEDGSADTWNPAFGSWWLANQDMETALAYADYDLAHAWGTHGHDFSVMCAILPEVLLATKEPAEKIGLPEIRLITQAERNSLDEMVNAVCTKVFGPDWKKRGRRRQCGMKPATRAEFVKHVARKRESH
jgi:hypothetical protein